MKLFFLKYLECVKNLLPLHRRSKQANKAIKIYCGVEQLVARRAHNPEVIGSSPVPATKNPCKQLVYKGLFFMGVQLGDSFKQFQSKFNYS